MSDYWADGWQEILAHNGLCAFADFWELQADWFEEPNRRRGGWSGVARCELALPGGGTRGVFLKRQENHVTRTWRHPVRGTATLARELDNCFLFRRLRIPTCVPLHFAQRRVGGTLRAVLLLEELQGYRSLFDLMAEWRRQGPPPLAERKRVIEALAAFIRGMHRQRVWHRGLYTKHLFLRLPAPGASAIDVRIIDLETARRRWWRWFVTVRDLSTLDRNCERCSLRDRVRFYKAYLGLARLRDNLRLWRAIARRSAGRRGG
jgi:hypothetical protein